MKVRAPCHARCQGRAALWAVLMLAGLGVVLSGCRSMKSGMSDASITIDGHTLGEVALTVRSVFEEDGFKLAQVKQDLLVFERPGNKTDALNYGGWDGSGVVIRAKVEIQPVAAASHFVRCDVYAVRDSGSGFMEEENPMLILRRKDYRRLLEETKTRLEGPAAPQDSTTN